MSTKMSDKEFYDRIRPLFGKLTTQQVTEFNKILASSLRDAFIAGMIGTTMRLSDVGVKFIEQWEGLKLKAYRDSKGLPTIGIGTTRYPDGRKVQMGDTCTVAQAREWFKYDVARFEKHINQIIRVPLRQNQFDALVSLVYNIGEEGFAGGTVDDKINSGNITAALDTWKKYINSGGKVVPGLINRRNAEVALFQS